MKTIRNIVGLTMMAIAFIATSLSAQIPSTLPIGSQDELREYALGLVDHGSRSIYSESIDWSYDENNTSTSCEGTGAENVLEKLIGTTLTYRLANTNDLIRGHTWLYGKDNDLLFYGYAEYDVASGENPIYSVWIQNIPLLSGVESAEILALGEDGKTANGNPIKIENGRIMFPAWYAGKENGVLSVKFTDGTLATYNLNNPRAVMLNGSVELPSTFKINGHTVIDGPGKGGTAINITEIYYRPTALLRLAYEDEVLINVMGLVQDESISTFERPTSVVITYQGMTYTISLDQEKPSLIRFSAGEYRLRFNWTKFGRPGMLYTGPSDGGKG